MYCVYCGKELEEDSKFCRYCGMPVVDDPLPQDQASYTPGAAPAAYEETKVPENTEPVMQPAVKTKKKRTGLVLAAVILLLASIGGGTYYYKKIQAEKEEEWRRAQAEQEHQAWIDSINEKMDDYALDIAVAIEEKLDSRGVTGAAALYKIWEEVGAVIDEGSSLSFKLSDEHMFEDIIFYKYNGESFVYYGALDDEGKRTDVGFIAAILFTHRGTELYSLQAEWENDMPNGRIIEAYIYGDSFDKKVIYSGTVKNGFYDGDITILRSDGLYDCVFHDGIPEVINEDGDKCAIGVHEEDGSYLYVDKENAAGLWFVQYPH